MEHYEEAFMQLLKETEKGTIKVGFNGVDRATQKPLYIIEFKDDFILGASNDIAEMLVRRITMSSYYEVPEHCPVCGIEINADEGYCTQCKKNYKAEYDAEQSERA